MSRARWLEGGASYPLWHAHVHKLCVDNGTRVGILGDLGALHCPIRWDEPERCWLVATSEALQEAVVELLLCRWDGRVVLGGQLAFYIEELSFIITVVRFMRLWACGQGVCGP
jgi:hypothetical protein